MRTNRPFTCPLFGPARLSILGGRGGLSILRLVGIGVLGLAITGCGQPEAKPVPCESITPASPAEHPSAKPLFLDQAATQPTPDLLAEWTSRLSTLRPTTPETASTTSNPGSR